MRFVEIAGRRYAQFAKLADQPGLLHAFSTRPQDVSARDDADAPARAQRRAQMAQDWGVSPERLHYCVQVHQPRRRRITHASPTGPQESIDALYSDAHGAGLMTFSADCPLVLVFDVRRAVVAMVHASWRCSVAQATRLLIADLRAEFGCDPRELQAGIGPSAGPCCYEVKADVWEAAANLPRRESLFLQRGGRLYFDLWLANRTQLECAGLPSENIELSEICTMCRTDLFYSFRREGPGCGHFGLLAAIRGS